MPFFVRHFCLIFLYMRLWIFFLSFVWTLSLCAEINKLNGAGINKILVACGVASMPCNAKVHIEERKRHFVIIYCPSNKV